MFEVGASERGRGFGFRGVFAVLGTGGAERLLVFGAKSLSQVLRGLMARSWRWQLQL